MHLLCPSCLLGFLPTMRDHEFLNNFVQNCFVLTQREKRAILRELINEQDPQGTIIFVKRKADVDFLATLMSNMGKLLFKTTLNNHHPHRRLVITITFKKWLWRKGPTTHATTRRQ